MRLELFIDTNDKWPAGGAPEEILLELERLVSIYQSPKMKQVYDIAIRFSNPPPLTKNLKKASDIIFGTTDNAVVLRDRNTKDKWHSLLHKADGKYCISIFDWRSTDNELVEGLKALPISQKPLSNICCENLDIGSDEIILVALPPDDLAEFKKVSPKFFKFNSTKIRPTRTWSLS